MHAKRCPKPEYNYQDLYFHPLVEMLQTDKSFPSTSLHLSHLETVILVETLTAAFVEKPVEAQAQFTSCPLG